MKGTPIFLACLLSLTSCAILGLGEPEEKWVEKEVHGVSYEDLWAVSMQALAQGQFAVKDEDTVVGKIMSSWRYELNPYSRDEKRYRATMEMKRRDGGAVLVRVRVEREGNEKMEATMNPEHGKWKPEGEDEEQARFLVQYVLLKTKTFGPSDDFYKKERWKKPGG